MNAYQLAQENILKQLNSRLSEEDLSIEDLNLATFIILNIRECQLPDEHSVVSL